MLVAEVLHFYALFLKKKTDRKCFNTKARNLQKFQTLSIFLTSLFDIKSNCLQSNSVLSAIRQLVTTAVYRAKRTTIIIGKSKVEEFLKVF